MTRKLLPLALLALTATLFAADSRPAAKPPAVGDAAKDFTLKTLDNKDVKLSELTKTGPVVVVVLRGWVTYQCPACTKQVAELVGNAKELNAVNANVILVYPGPAEKLTEHGKEFAPKDFPANFHFVLDPDLKFVLDWNLRWYGDKETAYPSTFVVDKDNKITYAKISKTHGGRAPTAEVLKALKQNP